MTNTLVLKGFFSIALPPGWSEEVDEGVVTIFDQDNGVGALQISFARRTELAQPSLYEAVGLAKQFLDERGWKVPEGSVMPRTIGLAPGSEISVIDSEGRYWRFWHIISLKRVAFVTYSCDGEDAEVERQACDAMIASFRWLPA